MKLISNIYKFLLTFQQRKNLALLTCLILIGTLLELIGIGLIIPIVISIMDSGFYEKYPDVIYLFGQYFEPTYENIAVFSIVLLLIFYVFKTLYLVYMSYKQGVIIYNIKEVVAKRLFTGYMHKPYFFYLIRNSSELIRNLTAEVSNLGMVLRAGITIFIDGIILISVLTLLMFIEPQGTSIIFLIIGSTALIYQYVTKQRLLKYGKSRQQSEGKRIQHVQQGIASVKDVKILSREREFIEQFDKYNVMGVKAERFQYILAAMPRLLLEFVVIFGLTALISFLIFSGKNKESITLILSIYAVAVFRLLPSINRILGSIQQLRFCYPSANVLANELKLIEEENKVLEQNKNEKNIKIFFQNQIIVSNLSFIHRGATEYTISDMNINILHGQCVGLVGGSGGGKSTLIDIILGLLKPSMGEILVDNVDIQKNLSEWQKKIGYVPQHIYLTDDTLKNNIAFGIPDEKIDNIAIENAVKASQLRDVVDDLPNGIDTVIGERGVRLSGGQRQRIGIARAMYHNPDVLIMDEATSALDYQKEAEIMLTIDQLHGKKTIIIVSHRINTLSICDKIYHLENGRIANEGNFKEIIENLN
jgi:ATP-binding cassette, subfamily B, bacterial PglK